MGRHVRELIGRLNPATGEMREYKLAPDARPHSIINDQAGNIWYTGNGNGTVGRLDPRTGEIKVYPMPDPAARDPHTPIFDRKGTLWFTLQGANMVGRLVPATGEIKLIDDADAERAAVRHHREFAGRAVGLLQRLEQARQHRSDDTGRPRVRDTDARLAHPAARRASRRHDLLR